MSEYTFGCGHGHLYAKAARIAKQRGVVLVNYTDPQCRCGHGCAPCTCKASRRHWFSCENRGSPFDGETERQVMEAIKAAGADKPKN